MWLRCKAFLQSLYKQVLYLRHRYGPTHFRPVHGRKNLKLLIGAPEDTWLDSSMDGELWQVKRKWVFTMKNILLLGAPAHRLEKVVNFTLMTFLLELYNPIDREILRRFVGRKLALARRLAAKWEWLNGGRIRLIDIEINCALYERGSWMQEEMISWMRNALRRQKVPPIIHEVGKGLKKGIAPLIVTKGKSGSYWMRGPDGAILGLFKPFDEELLAPNNPLGPGYQGALGKRASRRGIRVGEAAHREVAAFVIDDFLGLGIVPRTYYASFTHQHFYLARENRLKGRPAAKTKWGSFQEYIEGFVPLADFVKAGEDPGIPLIEFQLLVVLDLLLGNTDRHIANILVGEEKLAAIDNGLTLSDVHSTLTIDYWEFMSAGREPFFPAIVELLKHFPLEPLIHKLRKRCMIEQGALDRMRERLALFTEGVLAGLNAAQLHSLITPERLTLLEDLVTTLRPKAASLVAEWQKSLLSDATNPQK